ncbi:uncharacterized protein LOC144446272 [Glandiceps talaboti]
MESTTMNLSINKAMPYANGMPVGSENMMTSWTTYVTLNPPLTTRDAVNLTNVTDYTEEPPAMPSTLFIILSTVALSITVLLVIFGNILVLLAVALERSLRTVTHYFIVNLAVADLLLGTTVLPFSATYEIIPYWPFGPTFCDIWAAVDVLCCTASINSLCVISIDRYIGVTRPLQHNLIMTKRRASIIIGIVWLFSVAISAGPLFGWREPTKDPHICPLTDSLDYVLFSVAGSFYIPLIIILVLYYRIYREAIIQTRFLMAGEKTGKGKNDVTLRVHTSQQRTDGNRRPRQSAESNSPIMKGKSRSLSTGLASKLQRFNKEKKAAKTLGIVVGVFIGCWLPFFLLLPITSICGPPCFPPDLVFKVAFWLGYCNSCLNPIIYAMSNRYFKRAFKRILTCRFGRRRQRNRNHYMRSSGKQLIKYQNSLNGSHVKSHRHYRKKNMSIASTSGYELTEVSVMNASPSVSHSSMNSKNEEGIREEFEVMTDNIRRMQNDVGKQNLDKQANYVNLNVANADENCNSETDKLLIDSNTNNDNKVVSSHERGNSNDILRNQNGDTSNEMSFRHQNGDTSNEMLLRHHNGDTKNDMLLRHQNEDISNEVLVRHQNGDISNEVLLRHQNGDTSNEMLVRHQNGDASNDTLLRHQNGTDETNISMFSKQDYKPEISQQPEVCSRCHRRLADRNVRDSGVANESDNVTTPDNNLSDKVEIPTTCKTFSSPDAVTADVTLQSSQPATWERLSSPESETTEPCSSEDVMSRSRESIFSLQIIEEGDVPLTVPSRQDVRSKLRSRKRNIHMKETKLTNSGVQTGDSLMSLEFLQECLEKKTQYRKICEPSTETGNSESQSKDSTKHILTEQTLAMEGNFTQSS